MRLRYAVLTLCLAVAAWARAASPEAARWYVSANTLYQQKQYDQALQHYAQSLRLDKAQPAAYQGVGNCYLAKGDRARALQYYRYALQLNPANSSLRDYIARAEQASPAADHGGGSQAAQAQRLYKARNYSEALASYQAALAAEPDNPRLHQAVGNCHYALGDKHAALASYRRALALEPANSALQAFVGKLEQSTGNYASASISPGEAFQPVWRSALLPGWGQAYNGQTLKGIVLGGLTLGCLAGEAATFVAGNAARDQYLGLSGPNADYDTPYRNWEAMSQLNHAFFVGMTVAYVYTLVDAGMNARGRQVALGPEPEGPVSVALSGGGASMTLRLMEF